MLQTDFAKDVVHRVIFLIFAIATIVVPASRLASADNSSIPKDSYSDWIGVMLGVVIPALALLIIGAIIYSWLMRKKRKYEKSRVEHRLRATPTLQRYEQDLPVSNEKIWELDELADSSLEEVSLNALENAIRLREANRIREYYAAISKIIRQYVGMRFDIKITTSTTGEILESLPQNLTESTVDHVGEILRTCDIVELAQYKPSNAHLDQIYQLAVEFIENQTKRDA